MFPDASWTLVLIAKFKVANVLEDSNVLFGLSHWYSVKTFVSGTPVCPPVPPVSPCVIVASFTVSFNNSILLLPVNKSVVMLFILYLSWFIITVSASV